jgi:N-methylhydantoinase A
MSRDPSLFDEVRKAFDGAYAQRYGYASEDQPVEATTWKVTAYGEGPKVDLPRFPPRAGDSVAERRLAYFPELGGFVDTPVHDRERLSPAARLEGPAIIEERESTTVLPPGMRAEVDAYGNLIVEVR